MSPSMALTLLLVASFLVSYTYGNNTRENVDGCKTTYTLGYGYKKMYHILEAGEHSDQNLTFRFYVKAHSDAHVLLSSTEVPTDSDPAYEVVIGGGRNTFSVIRSQRRQYTRAHVTTPDILSSEEYRGFWITLSPPGHLEVGKANDRAPFLFWDDPQPAVIHYFGFCNWANIVGQWAYNCPNELKSEETNENLTSLERLRKDLFAHYDPYSRPVILTNDITTVFLQVENRAVRIDEKRSIMYVAADVYLQWQDQKLQWDPSLHENISQLFMFYGEIWQPDLVLYNAVGPGNGFLAAESMTVSPTGTVKWKTVMNVEVHCKLDLSKWPYDSQICDLQLGYWTEQHFLQLLYSNEPQNKSPQSITEWEVEDLKYINARIKTPLTDESKVPEEAALIIRYKLLRKNVIYRAVFGVPLLVISITMLLPFWISPLNPNKLNILCLSLVIIGILLLGLARILPAPADHVPSLVQTYSRGMIAVTFSILISVAVIAISRTRITRPVPSIFKRILERKFVQLLLVLPPAFDKDASNYKCLQDNCNSNSIPQDENQFNSEEIREQWFLFAIFIDRISFFIYSIYIAIAYFVQI